MAIVTVVTITWNVNGGEDVVVEMSDVENIVRAPQNLNANGVIFRTSCKEVDIPDEEF